MTIPFTTLFTQIGRYGRLLYLIDIAENTLPAGYTSLIAQVGTSFPVQNSPVATAQQQATRSLSNGVAAMANAAAGILMATVAADVPSQGGSIVSALTELRTQMIANSQSVQVCTVGASSSAISGIVGTGIVVITTKRGDGLVQENIVAEIARLTCTADSYTGGQTQGQEQFTFQGAANSGGVFDYDWPQGSAANLRFNAVSAANQASPSGNLLTNGGFELWSGTPLACQNWTLSTGVYGTDVIRNTTAFQGTYSLQIHATATNPVFYQQFGVTTGGTPVSPTLVTSYVVNFWMATTSGTASAGVLTVKLVDASGTTINDDQGNANSFTVTLSTLTTTFSAHNAVFRLPGVTPSAVRLEFAITTALTGTDVLIDSCCFCLVSAPYPNGPGIVVFSGATPYEVGDTYNLTMTNNRGGSSFSATFQALFLRFFSQTSYLLPSSGSPTQADTLITSP